MRDVKYMVIRKGCIMALIKCPECGREKVSDSADACPSCGFGIKQYFAEKHADEKRKIET